MKLEHRLFGLKMSWLPSRELTRFHQTGRVAVFFISFFAAHIDLDCFTTLGALFQSPLWKCFVRGLISPYCESFPLNHFLWFCHFQGSLFVWNWGGYLLYLKLSTFRLALFEPWFDSLREFPVTLVLVSPA